MSAVYGLINRNGQHVDPEHAQKMSLAHSWIKYGTHENILDHQTLLGCCMVSNTPESQYEILPMYDNSRELIITADVRIDNRLELAQKLKINKVEEIGDATLILAAYKKYDINCLKHIIGAFAFIIWDKRKQRMFCARDHLGVRPLFYYLKEDVFAFGTVKKAICALTNVDKTINKDFIINQVGGLSQELTDTFYQYINRLPPAHYLTIGNEGVVLKKYWELDDQQETNFKNDSEYVEAFREYFNQSISARIRSKKNIGSELSGGLDSSGITAFAQKQLLNQGKSLHTFSLIMADEDVGKEFPYDDEFAKNSETELIRELCEMANIKDAHYISGTSNEGFLKPIDDTIQLLDGLSEYGTADDVIQAKAALNNVNVLLSGFPGDELVTSSCSNAHLEYLDKANWWNYLFSSSKTNSKNINWKRNIAYLFLKTTYGIHASFGELIDKRIQTLRSDRRSRNKHLTKSFFSEDFLRMNPGINEKIHSIDFHPTELRFKEWQKNRVLRSNTSMRMESENTIGLKHGVETRYPLSDIRLLQYVLSIPIDQKIRNGISRFLYRRGVEGYIPLSIVYRDTKGGSARPFWFKEYKKIHEDRIKWLVDARSDERLYFLDHDKLIEKASAVIKQAQRNNVTTKIMGFRQGVMMYLIRYHQLNPDLKLF